MQAVQHYEMADVASYRYAIYWSPQPGSALADLSLQWLGRDAQSGRKTSLPTIAGLTDTQVAELLHRPAHYGLHATLKAPFRLKSSVTVAELMEGVAQFAAQQSMFTLPPLVLNCIDGVYSLVPQTTSHAVNALAEACVVDLDYLRAPLNNDDLKRRQLHRLTVDQRARVYRWGYTNVLDAFSMHLTLTSQCDALYRTHVDAALRERAHHWQLPQCVDSLSVFAQATPDAEFELLQRFPLAADST